MAEREGRRLGYVGELLAKATSQCALDQELTGDDKERLIAFLRGWGSLGSASDGYAYTGSPGRGYSVYPGGAGQPGVEYGPLPSLSDVFASGVGRYFSFEFEFDMAMMMFQPVGGMDQIPRALTRAIGQEKILLGCQATSIIDGADIVTVEYTDANGKTRSITADYAIAAMPPWFIAGLTGNLGPGVQTALAAVKPSSASKMGLEYKSRWWETDYHLYGGITDTDLDLNVIWTPSYGYHGERGVIIGYYNYGSVADMYGQMTPLQRQQRALSLGADLRAEVHVRVRLVVLPVLALHPAPAGRLAQRPDPGRAGDAAPGGPGRPGVLRGRLAVLLGCLAAWRDQFRARGGLQAERPGAVQLMQAPRDAGLTETPRRDRREARSRREPAHPMPACIVGSYLKVLGSKLSAIAEWLR